VCVCVFVGVCVCVYEYEMEEARRLRHVNRSKPIVKLRNKELFNAGWG
jgi:hypothetical protein